MERGVAVLTFDMAVNALNYASSEPLHFVYSSGKAGVGLVKPGLTNFAVVRLYTYDLGKQIIYF